MSGVSPSGDDGRRDDRSAMRQASPFLTAGIQLAASVVVMFFLGHWLDERWHTAPWLVIIGSMAGAAAGFTQFIRAVNAVTRQEQEDARRRSTDGSGKRGTCS